MPVPLPPRPTGTVQLPPPPNDPPTLEDVINAIDYYEAVKLDNKQRRSGATNNDVARASAYKTNVEVACGRDSAPAWLAPAVAVALGRAIANALAPVQRLAAKSYNMRCSDGNSRPYEIVPFVDGSLPTEDPHNLPPLVNTQAVKALSGAETTAYMNGYGLAAVHHIHNRKLAIKREIGCLH